MLDKEQLVTLVEMMSLQMSYAAMSSLGGLSSDDEKSRPASPFLSSITGCLPWNQATRQNSASRDSPAAGSHPVSTGQAMQTS